MIVDDPRSDFSVTAAVSAEPIEAFSPALAALKRPPKVGDVIEHDGRDVKIIGTAIRGAGDFSVEIEGGGTLHSR